MSLSFRYIPTATDPENDAVTFTFSDFPGWMTSTDTQISGIPGEGVTNASFTVTTSDGQLMMRKIS